jgi:AcrR family transcriptional regulator
MGRRDDKKRETRERLQAAAFARFQRDGYDETKIEDIALDAGVSPRTVYRYFPTKADLVYPDTGDNVATVTQLIAERPPSEAPFVALRAALVQFAPTLDSEVNFARGRLIAIDPTLYRYSLEVRDRMGNAMGQALVDRGGAGATEADRRLLGHLAMVSLLVALRTWRDEGDDADSLAEHAARTLDAIPRLVKM